MSGFRAGSVSWRAVLTGPTSYAPDGVASRAQGHRLSEVRPLDMAELHVVIDDPRAAKIQQRVSIEHGIDRSVLIWASPLDVSIGSPARFDRISLFARRMSDMGPGAKSTEIAVMELCAAGASIWIVHAPGETIVQKRQAV